MKYKISGDNLQLVTLEIEPNEKVYAEAGALVYMSNNINMEAKMRGGFLKGLGRTLAGETLFLTEFTSASGSGLISFGGRAPGTIKPIEMSNGKEFIVQKDAFLCAEDSIDMSIAFDYTVYGEIVDSHGLYLLDSKNKQKFVIYFPNG